MEDTEIDKETITDRRKYVEDLKEFITEYQDKISSLLQTLSWTPEHFARVSVLWTLLKDMLQIRYLLNDIMTISLFSYGI